MLLLLNFEHMFTGIIETTGILRQMSTTGSNKSFWVESNLSTELKVDQSLAHSGVCLTIEAVEGNLHKVTAIQETLQKTNLNSWQPGDYINIERCLQLSARLDGHFVQGHVDACGSLLEKKDLNGSWQYSFSYPSEFAALMIEKGSITVNGISLTAFNVGKNSFDVGIIPYTYTHTNLQYIPVGGLVNLEFDLIGKYINRMQEIK